MGIAGDLAPDGAQAETLFGIVAGIAQSAIVKDQRLAARAFKIKLAVLGAIQRRAQDFQRAILVKMGLERENEASVMRTCPCLDASPRAFLTESR